MKQTRNIAKGIYRKVKLSKRDNDSKARDRELKEEDLIMLKVQPRFRLDCFFKGPSRIKSLTATNVVIVLEGSKSTQPWNDNICQSVMIQ